MSGLNFIEESIKSNIFQYGKISLINVMTKTCLFKNCFGSHLSKLQVSDHKATLWLRISNLRHCVEQTSVRKWLLKEPLLWRWCSSVGNAPNCKPEAQCFQCALLWYPHWMHSRIQIFQMYKASKQGRQQSSVGRMPTSETKVKNLKHSPERLFMHTKNQLGTGFWNFDN
jgi:hypothetical protein